MGKRQSQDTKDIKVYSFKFDRRIDIEAAARKALDEYLSQEGTNLRELMARWLTEPGKEWVIVGDHAIGSEIRAAFREFRTEFFVDLLAFMRANNIEVLRNYVSDEAVEAGTPLDAGFVDTMMNLFDNGEG